MQRQKEAVALATAQNRILQQQCKFFFNFRPFFEEPKILFLGQNTIFRQKIDFFFNFGPKFELGLKCVPLIKIRLFSISDQNFRFFKPNFDFKLEIRTKIRVWTEMRFLYQNSTFSILDQNFWFNQIPVTVIL